MSKYKRSWNKKWVAHTKNDKRYKRSNRVKMNECPFCKSLNLVEKSEGNQVWVDCLRCNISGYDCRINNSHLWIAEDLIATLVDAYYGEEEDDLSEQLEEEEENN